jgi:hypothetical protein
MALTEDRLLGEVGQTLFHYTSLSAGVEHILPSMTLRMSPFSAMRDPREAKRWAVAGAGFLDDDTEGAERRLAEFDHALNELKDTCKLLSFTRDDMTGEPGYRRGYARPRLWEQYAGRSTGLCLAFNEARLTVSLETQLGHYLRFDHGPVQYPDRRLSRQLSIDLAPSKQDLANQLEAHLRAHWQALFFTKLTDWSAEHEYRYVARTTTTEPVLVDVSDALIAVCMGPDLAKEYLPALLELVRGTEIRVRKLTWWNNEPLVTGFSEPLRLRHASPHSARADAYR